MLEDSSRIWTSIKIDKNLILYFLYLYFPMILVRSISEMFEKASQEIIS